MEGLLGVQAGVACRFHQGRDGCRATLGVAQGGFFGPFGQRGNQLGVMGPFLVGVDAFILHVLHAEQAQRVGGILQVAVLVGEIAPEGLLQGGLCVLGGQGGQHGLQLVVQGQLGQWPAAAVLDPGGFQLGKIGGRHGVTGEGLQVVVVQVLGQLQYGGLGLAGGCCGRWLGCALAASHGQQQAQPDLGDIR